MDGNLTRLSTTTPPSTLGVPAPASGGDQALAAQSASLNPREPSAVSVASKLHAAGIETNAGEIAQLQTDTEGALKKSIQSTALSQGSKAYALSFGGAGLAQRCLAWGINKATASYAGSDATLAARSATLAASLASPIVHGKGAQIAGGTLTGQDTFAVQPDPKNPISQGNLVGDAFRPFVLGLSAGNLTVNLVAEGTRALHEFAQSAPLAETLASGSGSLEGSAEGLLEGSASGFAASGGSGVAEGVGSGAHVSLDMPEEADPTSKFLTWGPSDTQTLVNTLGLWIPGNLSAVKTAENVQSGRLELGFSLQTPAGQGEKAEAAFVLHQTPVPREDGTQELGKLVVNGKDGSSYVFSHVSGADGSKLVLNEAQPQPRPEASSETSIGDRLMQALPTQQTVVKTVALGSTLAAIGAVSMGLTPVLVAGFTNAGLNSMAAGFLARATSSVISNMLLAQDFVPKFQTFSQPVEGHADLAKKIALAAVPVIGGAIAQATGKTSSSNIPGLDNNKFGLIAEEKLSLTADLATLGADNSVPGLVAKTEGKLSINADKLLDLAQSLDAARQPTATGEAVALNMDSLMEEQEERPSLSRLSSLSTSFIDTAPVTDESQQVSIEMEPQAGVGEVGGSVSSPEQTAINMD